jgi:hypothetical protein
MDFVIAFSGQAHTTGQKADYDNFLMVKAAEAAAFLQNGGKLPKRGRNCQSEGVRIIGCLYLSD